MKNKGATLVEVIVASAVMAIVATGLGSALLTTGAMRISTSEHAHASALLQERIEAIMASYREDNGTSQNNLDWTIDQNTQAAAETVAFGDGTTATLNVVFYLDEANVPTELGAGSTTTNARGESFGPLDLNGDGDTADDHSASTNDVYGANLVPVEVNVEWMNKGEQLKERRFLLLARVDGMGGA